MGRLVQARDMPMQPAVLEAFEDVRTFDVAWRCTVSVFFFLEVQLSAVGNFCVCTILHIFDHVGMLR